MMVPSNPEPGAIPMIFPSSSKPPNLDHEVDNWPQFPQKERMIQPCEDYLLHYSWLQHNFPLTHSSDRKYFVYLVLKIKTFLDIGKWLSYTPDEWATILGQHTYGKICRHYH